MLFSESNKREPYRPAKYRPKTALENDSNQEEGLFGDEFEGEISNDPLEDLVDHAWAVDPNEDQVVNFEDEPIVDFEEEYEREDPITNTASRTSYKGFPYNNLQEQPFLPGHKWPTYLYRGLVITMPSDEWEQLNLAVMDNDQREMYRIGKKVLNIISSKGMGRHWTTEPDVAMDFASMNASNGNLAVVLSVVWERDGEDLATEHEGYDGVVRPSRLVGEEEVTLERGTRIKVISMKASRVDNGDLFERDFSLDLLDTPQTKTASQLVANDGVLDSLNPTGTVFTEYNPQGRASLDLAPNIAPYSETSGLSPDDRVVVYRGVPKGVQSELADGDFITDMEQLAKDYAGTGDVISQEVFADEILDDLDDPMAGEYLFRPRRASKKTASEELEEDDLLDTLNPTGSIFVDYDPDSRASKDLAPNIVPYSETAGISPDERLKVYRGVPKGVQSELADGDFITDMKQLAQDYAGTGDVITQYVFADEVLDDTDNPMAGEYLFRPRRTSSRREADRFQDDKYQPGTLYRGLSVDLLSDDEVNTLQDWAARNSFDPEDPDGFDFAEPNFEMIYPILDRLEESGGLGRHWSKDYDVAEAFAGGWANDDPGNQGIILRVDWDGSGIDTDYDEATTTANGSTVGVYDEEKEVNLAPGAGANLVGIDFTDTWGNKSNIPVPDVPVYASKRREKKENSPGNIYRGIGTDMLTQEEYDEISSWADQNEYDPSNPDSFTMVQPNYDVIQPILERLEEQQGLGRHWSKDHNVAVDFAGHNSTYFDSNEEGNPPLGIVFRGDWVGEGEDLAEEQPGYDGVVRPSNWHEEKEVTLHPGSEVNLLGIDVFEPGGDFKNIPVPDIPVYSRKKTTRRKKEDVTAVNRYLRFANRRGLDPKDSRTSRSFRRASRGLSPRAMTEISSWMKAQKTAGNSARRVLANTRSYRHKMASGSWYLDNKLSAYVSKTPQKFACSCGSHIAVPSYTNCKCGKVWNAYKIHSASQGDTTFVVREVPVRENVLVANRRTASRRRNYR